MIQLKRLTKCYGQDEVVSDLTLTVLTGEILVVLGGSGSGKTTLLKMINRLVEPTTGTVQINGTDTSTMPPYQLRRQIGYVFQQVGLFPHMTVSENVAVTPSLLGWKPARIRNLVDELLELVELNPIMMRNRKPNELSGGQQQRVGVARALAAGPEVMLLDEPFGALDPLTRGRLQESFKTIQHEIGLTAVFVTHDMIEALMLGNRIAIMQSGKLIQIGTPHELLHQPATEYVEGLMSTPRRQAAIVSQLASESTT